MSLAIMAFLIYSSPNEWLLDRIYIGTTEERGSLENDAQIIDGIPWVNSTTTTLPLLQTIDHVKQSRPQETSHPENSIDEPAMIMEDSTKNSTENIQSLKNQQVEQHNSGVTQSPLNEIPNIFHFTHLQANPQTLDIGFQQFIAIYSA